MLCNFQIFSGCVCHLEQLLTKSPFLFPLVFGINLFLFRYCNFTNFRCVKISVASDHSVRFSVNVGIRGCWRDHSMYFSHLGVFLISVKPLTTESTENKTTPKFCKITVLAECLLFFHSFARVCAPLPALVLGPLRGRNCCCLWFWQLDFGVSLRAATSPLFPQPPIKQKCEESIRPSSSHNPTLSANKHVIQICRSSLSVAADHLADGSGER